MPNTAFKPRWPFVLNSNCDQAKSLVGWWPMEPANGRVVYDWSGYRNHAIYWSGIIRWQPGYSGGRSLDQTVGTTTGNRPLIASPTKVLTDLGAGTSPFTMACWVYLTVNNNFAGWFWIKNCGLGGEGDGAGVGVPSFVAADNLRQEQVGIPTPALGRWFHIAGVYTGSVYNLYINGRKSNGLNRADRGYGSHYGFMSGLNAGQGLIENACAWNRALSDSEVFDLYSPNTRWQLRYQPNRKRFVLPVGGSPVTITPGAGALVLTGYAPTVGVPRVLTPGKASLVLTGFAPTVSTPKVVTPGKASLVITGYAPTVSTNNIVTPGPASLALTGHAPLITVSAVTQPVVQVAPSKGLVTTDGMRGGYLIPEQWMGTRAQWQPPSNPVTIEEIEKSISSLGWRPRNMLDPDILAVLDLDFEMITDLLRY